MRVCVWQLASSLYLLFQMLPIEIELWPKHQDFVEGRFLSNASIRVHCLVNMIVLMIHLT